MEKVTRTYICDICHQEKEKDELKSFKIPTYSTFSSTDGAYHNPRVFGTNVMIHNSEVDVCYDCAIKIAVVKSVGVQREEYVYDGGFKGKKEGDKKHW